MTDGYKAVVRNGATYPVRSEWLDWARCANCNTAYDSDTATACVVCGTERPKPKVKAYLL